MSWLDVVKFVIQEGEKIAAGAAPEVVGPIIVGIEAIDKVLELFRPNTIAFKVGTAVDKVVTPQ